MASTTSTSSTSSASSSSASSSVAPTVPSTSEDAVKKNPHVKERGDATVTTTTTTTAPPTPTPQVVATTTTTTEVVSSTTPPPPVVPSVVTTASSTTTTTTTTKKFVDTVQNADLADKYFQLSEQEDEFSCLTELWFRPDGYVEVRETDGPRPKEWSGTWSIVNQNQQDGEQARSTNNDNDNDNKVQFELTLYRKFGAGDMFSFFIARRFTGSFYHIGRAGASTQLLGMEGTAREVDDFNTQVGSFTMIDATHLRQSGQYEISPKKGVGAGAFWRTKLVMNIEQK